MKKVLRLTLAVSMLLGMAACGGAPAASSSAAPAAASSSPAASSQAAPAATTGEKVTIEFWNSAEGNVGVAVESLVKKFNETVGAEKNIEVVSVFQGGDVAEKLKTLAQAEDWANFPDVGQIYGLSIPAIMEMPPNVPVEDLYASEGEISVQKADLVPSTVRAFEYAGKMIGMPLNSSTLLMYYNKTAYTEAGLDPEKPAATIDELANHVAALTKKEGDKITRYGLNVQIDRYEFVNFLGSMGDYNFVGDNEGGRAAPMTKLTIGEDGSLKKYLTEWQKVIATGGYKAVNDNEKEEFATGLSAINLQSTSQIANFTKFAAENGFELGVVPIPKVDPADKGGSAVGGGSLCAFDRGDPARLAAAWQFIQYCASPEVQFQLHLDTGYIPVNTKVMDMPEMQSHLDANPFFKVAIDQINISNPNVQEPFDIIGWELNTLVKSNMIEFANGNLTLEETHDAIVNGFNDKLDQYHKANG